MDNGGVAAEGSQPQTDSSPSASKSLESLVQINSIAIGISGGMEEIEPQVHEHFSIRGYVAGMRKKDASRCFPFTSEDDDDNKGVLSNLPPLSVPSFRWWRCSNCVSDISSEMSKELHVMDDSTNPACESRLVEHREGKDIGCITNFNPCSISGHNKATSKKGNKDLRDKMSGNRCPYVQEPNELPIRESLDKAGASDGVRIVHPPCTVGVVHKVSSGSDDASAVLMSKRKPKVRFLADIMVKEKKRPNSRDNTNARSVSPSEVQVTSSEETEPLVSPLLESDEMDKASRSLHRKRKNAVEEDSRLAKTIAKRSRGFVLDAGRTCRRLDSSDQESEENASRKVDLPPVAAKSRLIKLRKSKSLVSSKKSRQAQTDDGTVVPRDLRKTIAYSCTDNLEENAVSSQTNMAKIRHGPILVEEIVSGNQTDRNTMLPNSERSTGEAGREDLSLSSKIVAEDCNAKGKVALDLSLNSFMDVELNGNDQSTARTRRFIPDLNEECPLQSAVAQGRHLPNVFVKRDSPLHKTTDRYVSCCNEEPTDAERRVGFSNPQSNENGKKIGSASDDIPMEIVELLAKNQYERELGNSRKHLMPEGIIGSTSTTARGYTSTPHYTDGNRNTMNFPFAANRRSAVNVPNGILGIPVNFSQLRNCSRDATKLKESQLKVFNSLIPSEQRKMPFPGSSNPIITDPRMSLRTDLYWPPRRETEPGLNQNRSFVQTSNIAMSAFSDKYGRGKTINGVMEIDRGRSSHDGILNKKGRIGSGLKSSKGSLDPYSNDTIPALQLMSLMDRGISSGSSFKVGPGNFAEKPLSPCNYQSRVNGKEKQHFIAATSQMSPCNRFKDFPKLPDRFFFSGESSKKGSSRSQGQISVHVEGSSNVFMESAKTIPRLGVCTLNKNPADFSVPEARNKYTITARDLRPRKRNLAKEKPRTAANARGRKRQRVKGDLSSGKTKAAPEVK